MDHADVTTGTQRKGRTMELQIALAIVDELGGGEETRRRMAGWMGRESPTARRLRAAAARVLLALATRLAPAEERDAAPTPLLASGRGGA